MKNFLSYFHNDEKSTFQNFLAEDKSVSIHNQNFQDLALEIYKVTKGLPTKVFANTFKSRNEPNYKLCYIICSKIPAVNSVYIGTEGITFLGPKLWEPVPKKVKEK